VKKIALLSVALLLMLACTAVAPDVVYNFDEAADFSRFRTYKWVSMRDTPRIDDLRDKQIKDAVDVELARKGLNKTDAENNRSLSWLSVGNRNRDTNHFLQDKLGIRAGMGRGHLASKCGRYDYRAIFHSLLRPVGSGHVRLEEPQSCLAWHCK
jgi:hypothetical protein